jgi:hypothetical protein
MKNNKERYQRIAGENAEDENEMTLTTESLARQPYSDGDEAHFQQPDADNAAVTAAADSHFSASSETLPTASNNTLRRINNAKQQRAKRRNSRGSLSSELVMSDEELEDLTQEENNFHDHPPNSSSHGSLAGSLSDLHSYLSGTQSPFNASFDSQDDGPKLSSSPRSTEPRPIGGPTSTTSTTPRTYSFGLDDDDFEDEDDIHLKRYAIDFDTSTNSLTNSVHGTAGGGAMRSFESSSFWCGGIFQYLWFWFQTARQHARQRRAQLLLQQSERHWRHSLYICLVTTLCDATDGGIALAATALTVWALLLWQVTDMSLRRQICIAGLILWTIRFGARPARGYWIQHRHRWRESLRQSSSLPLESRLGHSNKQQQYSQTKTNSSTSTTTNKRSGGHGTTGAYADDDDDESPNDRSRTPSPVSSFAFAQPPSSMELTTLPDGITEAISSPMNSETMTRMTEQVQDPSIHII